MAPTSILASIEDKYSSDCLWSSGGSERDPDYGFIVYVSSSPECKRGMYPPIMTFVDYEIASVGNTSACLTRLNHISELDLTDNKLDDWAEVIKLLNDFPSLEFLNLSNNLLHSPLRDTDAFWENDSDPKKNLPMRKLVLNGNNLDWRSAHVLCSRMPQLEELHLSNNNLKDPETPGIFSHPNLRQLYLSCNPLSDFGAVSRNLAKHCPQLENLSVAECPLVLMKNDESEEVLDLPNLTTLNISTTKVSTWSEVDKIRAFPALSELRLQHCPVVSDLTAHERRMMLVARLPNIKILNGGDVIPANEREDAERGFIRFFNASEEVENRPQRYHELVQVHGDLDPLVNIDFAPATHVTVKVVHKEVSREEVIEVYQTVTQFKQKLHAWFGMPTQNMKVYYCDKDYGELAGPEEMKWPQKSLHTYNVQNGDSFILDEKVALPRLRTTSRSSVGSGIGGSPSPRPQSVVLSESASPKMAITFSIAPRNGFFSPKATKKGQKYSGPKNAGEVARNLFGKTQKAKSPQK